MDVKWKVFLRNIKIFKDAFTFSPMSNKTITHFVLWFIIA